MMLFWSDEKHMPQYMLQIPECLWLSWYFHEKRFSEFPLVPMANIRRMQLSLGKQLRVYLYQSHLLNLKFCLLNSLLRRHNHFHSMNLILLAHEATLVLQVIDREFPV